MGCTESTAARGAPSTPASPKPQRQGRKRKEGAPNQSQIETSNNDRKKGRPRSQRRNAPTAFPTGSATSEFQSGSPATEKPSKRKKPNARSTQKGGKSNYGSPTSPPSFKPCTSTESGNLHDLLLTLKVSSANPGRPTPEPVDDEILPLPSFPSEPELAIQHVALAGGPTKPHRNQNNCTTPPAVVVAPAQLEGCETVWIHDSSDSQSERNQDSGSAKAQKRSNSLQQLSTSTLGRIAYPPGSVVEPTPRGMGKGSNNALLTSDWRVRQGSASEKNVPDTVSRDRSSGSSADRRLLGPAKAAATSSSSAFSDSRGDSSVASGLFFQAEAERRCSNQGYERLEPIDPQWWKTTQQRNLQRGASSQPNPFVAPTPTHNPNPSPSRNSTLPSTNGPPPPPLQNVPETSISASGPRRISHGEGQVTTSAASKPQSPAQMNKVADWLEELKA